MPCGAAITCTAAVVACMPVNGVQARAAHREVGQSGASGLRQQLCAPPLHGPPWGAAQHLGDMCPPTSPPHTHAGP
jgi:hypothetical protein